MRPGLQDPAGIVPWYNPQNTDPLLTPQKPLLDKASISVFHILNKKAG